jgi:hypothetical protein
MLDDDDIAMVSALGRHTSAHRLDDFLAQGARCGWCAHPVRLRGYVLAGDDRRVVFSSHAFPDNVVLKACGSRSELRCPSCARLYRGDARHLVRAGLEGGKGVEESVANHPAVFLTLTAPGFGSVHRERSTGLCHSGSADARCRHGRPHVCRARHAAGDQFVGTPLCAECFDYPGAALHNAYSTELWRRTTISVFRRLATSLGISRSECAKVLRLEHAKVAEFQRRGLVHFHAVLRADGPDGGPPPIEAETLARACVVAARRVEITHSRGTARWGRERDVQVLDRDDPSGAVASYVSKYVVKEPGMHPGLVAKILSASDLEGRDLPPHLFNLAATAWRLGSDPALASLGLRRHAHHLGYRGHVLTKSRRYSTTLGALRDARAAWHRERNDDSETESDVPATRRLKAVGRGWANKGEELFAAAQARQRVEERKEAEQAWYTRNE